MTWDDLVDSNLVLNSVPFLEECRNAKKPIPNDLTDPECWDVVQITNNLLLEHGVCNMEEFSMLVFGNILACVTHEVKKDKKSGLRDLKFSALPSVYIDTKDHGAKPT